MSSKAAARASLLTLPLPPLTLAEQRMPHPHRSSDVGVGFGNSRRILPLPSSSSSNAHRNADSSDAAQSVRMMLARHHHGSSSKLFDGGGGGEMAETDNERNESSSSDHFSSAVLPGDSFPATDQHLLPAHSFDDVDDEEGDGDGSSEDEREILRRLGQSQARMEQIKRMLVNQRGFIVASLRQMAESRASSSSNGVGRSTAPLNQNNLCTRCATSTSTSGSIAADASNDEKDRTLGSTIRHSVARREIRNSTNTDAIEDCEPGKLCPMCEAAFPGDVDPEAFESHVVEHFCFEEAETIKYVAPDDPQPQLQMKTKAVN